MKARFWSSEAKRWIFCWTLLIILMILFMSMVQESSITKLMAHPRPPKTCSSSSDAHDPASTCHSTHAAPGPVLYQVKPLELIPSTGWALRISTWVAVHSWFRPLVLRQYLHQQGVSRTLRQFAARPECAQLPLTTDPLIRLSAPEYQAHVTWAAQDDASAETRPAPTSSKAPKYRSVLDYHHLYQSGRATPSEVMEKILHVLGADRVDPETLSSQSIHDHHHHHSDPTPLQKLRMWAWLDPALVRQQATESTLRWRQGQPRSVWEGVPVAVKDMLVIHHHPLCVGAQSLLCQEPAANNISSSSHHHHHRRRPRNTHHPVTSNGDGRHEDPMIILLRQAGAIILGTTVMTEGGVTPLGYSVWYNGPFHPYNPEYYTGGSSSGSGVVVATGLVPMALGMDGGGSIRIPAAANGVYGLAGTWGRFPLLAPNIMSVVKSGPLTATARDAALALILLGQHPLPGDDHHHDQEEGASYFARLYDGGVRGPPPAHAASLTASVAGMRLGYYAEYFTHSDPEVVEACHRAVDFLQAQGATIVNMTIPHLQELYVAHTLRILGEIGMMADAIFSQAALALEWNTQGTIALGHTVTAGELWSADRVRSWGIKYLREEIFGRLQIDAIVSPTLGSKVPRPMGGYRATGESNTRKVYELMRFAPLANLLGLPGLSIPVDYEGDTGLPIGLQLLGDAWMEHKLLRVAHFLETHYPVARRTPPPPYFFDPLADWLS